MVNLDKTDLQITAILDCHERKSYIEVAQMLGINEKTVRNRITHMTERGAIHNSVLVGLEEFPEIYVAYCAIYGYPNIDLKSISEMPEVLFATSVSGRYEAIAVIVIKTREDLSKFRQRVASVRGVDRLETFMVIDNFGLKIPAKMLYNLMHQEQNDE